MAADMAAGQVLFFVQGQRHTAVGTLHFFPASLAGQHGEESAAVEKEDGLFALGQTRLDGAGQLRRDKLIVALAVFASQSHVHHAENGQDTAVVPVGQLKQVVFSLPAVLETFQRWRGRAEQNGAGFHLAADHGEIACVVTRTFILLVRRVVFLVDDDQPEILQRRKDRAARPDDNARLPVAHAVPLVMAFALAQMTVQHGHIDAARGKARGKPLHRLRRQ